MYYELRGRADKGRYPLVLIHGGGSTIESTYARILPEFARTRQVLALELQAHGHTKDIGRPLSFEQDANDIAALLNHLHIAKADIMGFTNGGMSALQLAIRDPQLVHKLVVASTPYKREGMKAGFFDGLSRATLKDMPQPLKDAYLNANPDPAGLQPMFDEDRARMLAFKNFSDSDLHAIQAPAFILDGDQDFFLPQHALDLFHLLPHARLAILPEGTLNILARLAQGIPTARFRP
jgi:pimeloyl-ACP methyl ester carboxylesterase